MRPRGCCRACGRSRWGLSKICRRRTCPGYAPIWAGDQRRKLFSNLKAFTDGSARVVLLTVTAPGAEVLPWDKGHCARLGPHSCSGTVGCRVEPDAAEAWNDSCPDRWRRLHRRVHQRVRQAAPELWMLTRVYELQHRGVLHVHPVLAFGTPGQRTAARLYLRFLTELAPQYGFGFANRNLEPATSGSAAAYLSAYFVTGAKEKTALHKSVMSSAMPRSLIHVSTKLSRATGVTMRELRYRRYVWRVAGTWVAADQYDIARAVARYHQEHGQAPDGERLGAILRACQATEP